MRKASSPRILSGPFAGLLSAALVLSASLFTPHAMAESTAIPTAAVPLKNTDFPASDLIHNGQPIDPDAAAELRATGVDLSRLNPAVTDVWQDTSFSASNDDQWNYPADGSQLAFHSLMLENPEGWMRSQVVGPNNQMFRLTVGLNIHQALMRAALLRKIGFPVQSPKWLSRVTLSFPSKAAKDNFAGEISIQAGLVDRERWVVSDNNANNTLVLQDVMIEPANIIVPTSFYLGNLNATHIEGRRILRSLLIPFVLLDVPESINMYSWEAGQVVSENVVLTHKYASAFDETTYDDARWILARIGKLTRDDWRQIVAAGRYPSDISAIILEKSVARRNNLVQLFRLQDQLGASQLNLPVNQRVSVGHVVEGKATKERYDGYALRFTHGDPESPLQTDDIVRYVKTEAITSLIKQITSRINEQLQFWTMDALLKNRSEQLRTQFFEQIMKNPRQPYSQPLSTWSGPLGGVSVNASRNIVTGSYYGDQSSDFRVNLVDQITAGARVGYFLGIDGIPNVIPGIGANLTVSRSYVHVRPVPSMQAADKKSWEELWVPGFMRNIGKALEKPVPGQTPEEKLKAMQDNMDDFLKDLKENEIFTVTDSLTLGANASVMIPLDALMASPLSFVANVSFGASANTIILRRTNFTRENGKIKIYLQNIQSQALGVSMDFNFWMNISRLSYTKKWGQAQTRAFHLEEKPSDEAKMRNTILAIQGVLKENNSEILEANFHPFQLDHRTNTDLIQGKFLWWRWTSLEEWHRVKVRPPRDPNRNFNPANHERTLFSHRLLERTGNNYYAFLGDILDGLVQNSTFFRPGLLDGQSGSNPKDSFMGNARWRVVTTEAETTRGRDSSPVTITEHFWAGWDLSKADLFRTIDGIDRRLRSLNLNLPLVNRAVFNDMRRLQLYEIRSTFIVYDSGTKKLRDRMLANNGNAGGFFERLVGWDIYSSTDKEFVDGVIVPMLGGQAEFERNCWEYNQRMWPGTQPPVSVIHRGRAYTCMTGWLKEILDLRRQYPATDKEGQVKWANRLLHLLEQNIELGKLISWIGKDNVFFQIKISGFRTRDENGDTADYTSSTVGTFNTRDRAGIFRDFAADFEIMSSELGASYLSEGF